MSICHAHQVGYFFKAKIMFFFCAILFFSEFTGLDKASSSSYNPQHCIMHMHSNSTDNMWIEGSKVLNTIIWYNKLLDCWYWFSSFNQQAFIGPLPYTKVLQDAGVLMINKIDLVLALIDFGVKLQGLTMLFFFTVASITKYYKLRSLNNTNVLCYSSLGQKSDMSPTGLNPRCWQGCISFWKQGLLAT